MPSKDEELTKAAAAYDAMLAEVLRNAANGIIPGTLIVSDHLGAERVQQVRSERTDAATTHEAPAA